MGLLNFSHVFVFGDSLVDAGNALRASEVYDDFIPFTSLPNGAPTEDKGYFEGRFTDGYTFADLISNKALSKPTSPIFPFGFISYPFQGDPGGNSLNFAYGGAQIRQGDESVPDLDDQTDAYRDAVDGVAPPNALHIFTFGANDVHDLVPKTGAWVDLATATDILEDLADEWIEEISQVMGMGAQHILALGVPDIGIQPYYNGVLDEAQRRAVATQYAELLDQMIQDRLYKLERPGVDFHFVSFTGMADDILSNLSNLYPTGLYPLNQSPIVFFDKVHPTAQLHALAAAYLIDDLTGQPAGETIRMASPDYSLGGRISVRDEVDRLIFALTAGSTYTFEMLGISSGKLPGLESWEVLADPKIRIYGPNGALVASNDDGGLGLDANLQFTAAQTGTYRVELVGVGAMTGFYTLQAANHTAANNVYIVNSSTTLVIEGPGDGNDRIKTSVDYALAPGSSIETLSTTNDAGVAFIKLTGNELKQTIIGNAGANTIDGKGGNDILFGKGGADTFIFSTALGPGNVDTIRDYDAARDSIRLDDAVFAGLPVGTLAAGAFRTGTAALDADDRIIFDPLSGKLYFDPDGVGGAPAQHFATLMGSDLNLTAADFFVT